MEEISGKLRAAPTFRQKLIICIAAVAVACSGLWFVKHREMWQDPAKIKVDPAIEERIGALLEESRTAAFEKKRTIFYEIHDMGQDGVPVLVRALRHEDPGVRAFSANLLQYCDNISVIPHLEARLVDEDSIVRRSALSALGHLGAFESAPTIILVLNDKDDFTRCQAALVLGSLGGKRAVSPLVEMLERDPYPIARRMAAHSLGEIGNEKAILPLVNSLNDRDYYVRSASLVALNRITGAGLGPRREQWTAWLSQK